jgi:hypothetical protein
MSTCDDVVKMACDRPTLVDALAYVALWESDRQSKQATFISSGLILQPGRYDCFRYVLGEVLKRWDLTH